MQATTTRPTITATADGEDVVSHAGSRLLADVADKSTLTAQLAEELAGLRKSRARHDPGRVLVDMAVAVADGATTISDVAVLADQAALFGAVASDSTCWRLLERLDTGRLGAVGRARAAAREVVWAQRAELSGQAFPPAEAAGREPARAGDRFGRLDRGASQNWHWHRLSISGRAVSGQDAASCVSRSSRLSPARKAAPTNRSLGRRRAVSDGSVASRGAVAVPVVG